MIMRWFVGVTVVAMLFVAGSALRSQPTNSLPLPVVQEVAQEDSTVLSITNRGSRTVLEVILANVSSMLPALDVRSDGAGAAVRTRGTAAGGAVEAVAAGSGSAAIFRNESSANTTSAVQILTASSGTALEVSASGTGPAAVLRGDVRVEGGLKLRGADIISLPIGAVLPFWGDPATLDASWVLCDGRLISDAASPLNGKRAPNLIEMFMRGANGQAQLGATGGRDSVPAHSHWFSGSGSVWIPNVSGNGWSAFGAFSPKTASAWDTSKFSLGKQNGSNNPYDTHGHMNGTVSIGANTLAAGDFDNRPRYLSMNFIMRVK
jgi:hypothetical protein